MGLLSCNTTAKQTALIFEPEKLAANYQFNMPEGAKELSIAAEKGVFLNGLLYERPGNTMLMIYFQGNARNLQNFLDNHAMVMSWGYNVLVTDYRGFGKSNGSLSGESKMYADAVKVYDYAHALGYPPEKIILYGYSMGTSMAAYLATVRKAKLLILESAFSSIPEISWVGNNAPDFELNTAENAKGIRIPTLVIHGAMDTVISPDHAERVFQDLGTTQKKLVLLDNGGHGNLKRRAEFQKLINDFVMLNN
jgi:pimeloyl-ACP methyl ester carboxylesterase